MASTTVAAQSRPVSLAPAPERGISGDLGSNEDPPGHNTMPYTCQTCAKRKVKCDKAIPICSSCQKGKLDCSYHAPPPRRRKRKLSNDIDERLAQYERILLQHGLLPQDNAQENATPPSTEDTPDEPIYLRLNEPALSRTGKLVAGKGKSRYIDSRLWRQIGDDEMQRMSDGEEDYNETIDTIDGPSSDPLTGAFIGVQQSLLQYHPNYAEALLLWKRHSESVEPLCKVLHIPSTSKMLETSAQQPATASRADECLLFSIYHFAVFTMTDEECSSGLGEARTTLMQRYNFATRQALVNASFLKTTEMSVLQGLVLFLLAGRFIYDPHTFWILTGVAVRIGQRMGLHRDGETLGLPPFEVQMRRRLFYQLVPLDNMSSIMSGTGIAIMPDTWDVKQPFNINDDQIWPGMTETPEEQKGATEMIFCLARSSIGNFFAKNALRGASSGQSKDSKEVDSKIDQVESEIEEKYLRYCNIIDPLHFLTLGFARTAITAMRIRIRIHGSTNQTRTDAETRELLQLTQKIMDTDTATTTSKTLQRFLWHIKTLFVWGSWESLVFVLKTLGKADLLTPSEVDAAWTRVGLIYTNHSELLDFKRSLHIAIGRLALKAWDTNPPSGFISEPEFITTLSSLRKGNRGSQPKRQGSTAATSDTMTHTMSPTSLFNENETYASFTDLSDDLGHNFGHDIDFANMDWSFWDQMIKDYQAEGSQ